VGIIKIINGKLVNEGHIKQKDILISDERIEKIGNSIQTPRNAKVFDAAGKYIIPGLIDDQVHFREPGLTHKATIESESKAAIAGGITSFLEMPNTIPNTTTIKEWEIKNIIASKTSYANYGFMFGGTNHNLEEIKALDEQKVPALKLFLGSSTGNMLIDNEKVLKEIFSSTNLVIAVHCEDENTIKKNLDKAKKKYDQNIPVSYHPIIRSEEACFFSSSKAVQLAKETGARLHVFHLSTAKEISLFQNDIPLEQKKITSEVCTHHLWFSDEDYLEKGSKIKWNPAIKSIKDQEALWDGLNKDYIDVLATDHAPHTLEEKLAPYLNSPSGGPLVQHSLSALLTSFHKNRISLEKIIEKACHNPSILFDIKDRGFIREGFFADLVIIDLEKNYTVKKTNILYKCGWSPFENETFKGIVEKTFVNGHLAYDKGKISTKIAGRALAFKR
tara:strand:+ start:3925 stop:5262 length:1338 start_codon:yes stop_codon:yes gene_type:complete